MTQTNPDQSAGPPPRSATDSQSASPPVAALRWEVHLAREAPLTGVLGGLLVVVFALAVDAATGSLLWALFAAVLLLLSLRRFFFPFSMQMDAAGLTWPGALRPRRVRWADLERVDLYPRWALLRLRSRGSAGRRARPLTLHFGRTPHEVSTRLRAHLPAATQLVEHAAPR